MKIIKMKKMYIYWYVVRDLFQYINIFYNKKVSINFIIYKNKNIYCSVEIIFK